MRNREFKMNQDWYTNKISDFDKRSCIGTAYRIVDDYIQKVILPEKYNEGNSKKYLPKELLIQLFSNLLCKTITDFERINDEYYSPITPKTLKSYMLNIPEEHIRYPQLSDFKFYQSRKAQKIFEDFTKKIHTIIPTYTGLAFENIHFLTLYRNFQS